MLSISGCTELGDELGTFSAVEPKLICSEQCSGFNVSFGIYF